MRAIRTICLVAALAVISIDIASADANLTRFYGSYTGFGFAEDSTGPFINTERDFELDIRPLESDGFELAWSTVKRKGNNPNSLEAVISQQAASFRRSGEPGIYHAINNGTVLEGGHLSWARLQGDLLKVYQLVIDESGVPELHVYHRMMTSRGLELLFTSSRDGKVVRTVRGRYRRR